MKTLLLLRHAKSSWHDAGLADFDRSLNKRGLKAAPLMGRYLRRKKIDMQIVLSSPAERARQTASLVIAAAASDPKLLRYDERIYAASAARLLEIVSQIEESADTALLVGHNPGLSDLVLMLTGEVHHMPTAALARISLNVDKWRGVRAGCGGLDWLVKPKQIERD